MRLVNKTYDGSTGFTDEYYYDDATNKLTIRRSQDVQDTLAENKRIYNSHTGKKPSYSDSEGGAHHVAHIPFSIIEKWLREDGFNWYNSTDKERKAKLNHRDNRHLLVRPGKL
tara:strand:+ start:1018 stop:1356 length:339 start_codon:yes stop_codon:yes gene_type:complete